MERELKSVRLNLVIAPSQVTEIDEWRKNQPGLPSRSEALRRLAATGLTAEPLLSDLLRWLENGAMADDPEVAASIRQLRQALGE